MTPSATPPLTLGAPASLAEIEPLLRAVRLPTDDLGDVAPEDARVAVRDGRPVGCVALQPLGGPSASAHLLRSLAVAPEARGEGIARRLVAAVEGLARERGAREIHLITTTAEPFFAALGYVSIARDDAPEAVRITRQFCGLCPGSAVVMRKEVGA